MKTLIAIAGCHAYKSKADAQRATWVQDVQGADVRFFAGGKRANKQPDEVFLDCPDDYEHRLEKVRAIFDWTLTQGYDYLWKVDDDVYLRPERLLALEPHHSQGHLMAHKTLHGVFTQLGACGGFSRRAMKLVLAEPIPPCNHRFEDVFVTLTLISKGITPFQRKHLMAFTHKHGDPFTWNMSAPPHPSNAIVAGFEYTPAQLHQIHSWF